MNEAIIGFAAGIGIIFIGTGLFFEGILPLMRKRNEKKEKEHMSPTKRKSLFIYKRPSLLRDLFFKEKDKTYQ